jgi:hypothetical protein|nr:MAG TPA: hypothetical protein [Caudoviricetes sp.]
MKNFFQPTTMPCYVKNYRPDLLGDTLTPKKLFKFPHGRVALDDFALHMIMARQTDSKFEFAEFYQNSRPNYVTNVVYIGDKDLYRLELTDRVGRVTHRDIPRSEGLWTDGESFFPGGEFDVLTPDAFWTKFHGNSSENAPLYVFFCGEKCRFSSMMRLVGVDAVLVTLTRPGGKTIFLQVDESVDGHFRKAANRWTIENANILQNETVKDCN